MRWREDAADTGGDTYGAVQQAAALEAPQADSAVPAAPAPPTDAPQATGDWKTKVAELGVDPGWVVAVRMKLVESGKIKMDDISPEALADPEHRKWLNRQMRKSNEEATQAAAAQTTAPTTTQPQPVQPGATTTTPSPTSARATPSVLKPGHMPTGPIWQSTATPAAGGGWMPAGNGLWWPPWPVTGGPIQKPAVQDATTQANALDITTGQARPEQRG